jgi:hypothetical protein
MSVGYHMYCLCVWSSLTEVLLSHLQKRPARDSPEVERLAHAFHRLVELSSLVLTDDTCYS